jgi:DNA-binding NtrC family response regulator
MDLLMQHEWRRNNVRELRNVVERMIVAAEGDRVTTENVPGEIAGQNVASPAGTPVTFAERKAEAERRIIFTALERNAWHISNTAAELGLADHSSLLKIMRRHGITRD